MIFAPSLKKWKQMEANGKKGTTQNIKNWTPQPNPSFTHSLGSRHHSETLPVNLPTLSGLGLSFSVGIVWLKPVLTQLPQIWRHSRINQHRVMKKNQNMATRFFFASTDSKDIRLPIGSCWVMKNLRVSELLNCLQNVRSFLMFYKVIPNIPNTKGEHA